MKNLSIGIVSAPRERVYLNQTVQHLRYEFPKSDIFIFAEPGTPKTVEANWIYNPVKLGVGYNWLSGLSYMYNNVSTRWIMMCEDDIFLARNFRSYVAEAMETLPLRNFGFFSPYCSYVNANPRHPGWSLAKRSCWGWCGMLCTVWTHEKFFNTSCCFLPDHGPDAYIADRVLEAGRRIYVHTPTLVEHTGIVSTGKVKAELMQRQSYDGIYHPPFYRNS